MSRWGGPSSSNGRPSDGRRPAALPALFSSISMLLEERVPVGRLVNVVGLVKDCRLPIPTSGTDHKMTVTLFGGSSEEEDNDSITISIFRKEDEMPVVDASDVMLILSAKLQRYNNNISLITNRNTDMFVYSARDIPKPPQSAERALQPSRRKCARLPNGKEHQYVSWLFHNADKYTIPDSESFQARNEQSVNVKNKFAELAHVAEGQFHDLVVQVVKDPFDSGGRVTIWVTDYTDNDSFFNHAWNGGGGGGGGGDDDGCTEDDPYGYISNFNRGDSDSTWPGPFGKKAMQITCYEPHASYIRGEVKAGDWVSLRNVQIKFGSNFANLEGFMREDRQTSRSKLLVDVLDPMEQMDQPDGRLKRAIQRKRNYEKEKKQQIRSVTGKPDAKKRKAEAEGTKNAKTRRLAKRTAVFERVAEREARQEELLGLNQNIVTENQSRQLTPLSTIIEPVYYPTTIAGAETRLTLPFINAKYRSPVTVVDFRPRRIQDFAVSRRMTEYDLLSDDEGGVEESSAASSSDEDAGTLDRYAGRRVWQWRFALQLEDASTTAAATTRNGRGRRGGGITTPPPTRVWAVVDNLDAQLLTGLNATDLRREPDDLDALRDRMFQLWGDLEEKKAAQQAARLKSAKRSAAGRPPLHSSDNEGGGGGDDDDDGGNRRKELSTSSSQVRNKPFACCIKQYGVRVPTRNPAEADAGDGMKWERVFGLFGTKISA